DGLSPSARPVVVDGLQRDHQAGDVVEVELVRDRMKQRLHRERDDADVQPLGQVEQITRRRVVGGSPSDGADALERAGEEEEKENEPREAQLDRQLKIDVV